MVICTAPIFLFLRPHFDVTRMQVLNNRKYKTSGEYYCEYNQSCAWYAKAVTKNLKKLAELQGFKKLSG